MDIPIQLSINIIVPSMLFGVMAAGFGVYYNVSKVLDLSQGVLVVVSGYIFFTFMNITGAFLVSTIGAVVLTVAIAIAINIFIYEKLRHQKKLSQVIAMIASAGTLLLIQNTLLAIFGSSTKVIDFAIKDLDSIKIFGAVLTQWQVIIIVVSIVLWIITHLIISKTKLGTAMRATADNEQVAEIVGISAKKSRRNAMVVASGISAIAGILIALEYNLHPNMGVEWAVRDFSRAVVGGIGSLPGALLGSFIIQSAEELGAWFWTSSYKEIISLILVFVFLIIKPTGILGNKDK